MRDDGPAWTPRPARFVADDCRPLHGTAICYLRGACSGAIPGLRSDRRPIVEIVRMRTRLMLPLLLVLTMPSISAAQTPPPENPLLAEWTTPFGVPPFDRFREEHFLPAYREAIARHAAEVAAIAGSKDAPTFANTVVALDEAGELLARVGAVFGGLSSAETTPGLQAIARETTPLVTAHRDDVLLDAALFRRVKAVWDARATLALAPDQARLLEYTYKDFVRGGALLSAADQQRLRAINTELAAASVTFRDNLLHDTNAFQLVIEQRADLAGLPERVVAGAAEAAAKAGQPGKWLFTLQAPSLWPFLQYADNRELRQRMFEAYTARADHGDASDNKAVLTRIASLRAERARLLGFASHADFMLAESMAKTPAAVDDLLERLWKPATRMAAREAADLAAAARADGKDFTLAPWDWFYYTEKIRKARYDVDEAALRPYFTLDNVRDGAFRVATRLYGITFTERKDLPTYNAEVRAFEVKDADGSHLAILYTDYFPRPGKRGGAWSGRYRDTYVRDGHEVRPVVVNVCSFSRPTGDDPALLSLEEVETLFHEFGHALHSMLSRVHYRGVSRTPQDFVELPSQIMENWAREPEVLRTFARHFRTGEVIPDSLVQRMTAARRFNQGFATTEYLAACLLDMRWHTLAAPVASLDPTAFENAAMAKIGMPSLIVPRYRSPYFQHVFAGGYSAGYYSYVWAEVLDADAFEAFKAKGLFDPATARAFRTEILEKGGSEDAMTMYRRFRGHEPSVKPLLARRGLE
jgi:peptidyl-dipeptidase Dcp